jgi:hypothetical protein
MADQNGTSKEEIYYGNEESEEEYTYYKQEISSIKEESSYTKHKSYLIKEEDSNTTKRSPWSIRNKRNRSHKFS